MHDQFLRELERSWPVQTPEAQARFVRELERHGRIEALDREAREILDRTQPNPRGVVLPLTSKLDPKRLVDETRSFLDEPNRWRLVVADHHYRSPSSAPDGTFALIDRANARIRVRVGRGDTDLVALVRRAAEAEAWDADETARELEARLNVRLETLTLSEPEARAWAISFRNQARASDMENVRRRPAMYIGDTTDRGLHQLVEEVLAIPLEFAAQGECSRIDVAISPDGAITIDHDAPGIGPDVDPRLALPKLEAVFTLLGWPRLGEGRVRYEMTGGLMGMGVMVVNTLSEWLEVESRHEGRTYFQAFARGWPTQPIDVRGPASERGLRVSFKPDPTIFKVIFSKDRLRRRLRELAFLNAGLRIGLRDDRLPRAQYAAPNGAVELVTDVAGEESILDEPIVVQATVLDSEGHALVIDGAITWSERHGKTVLGYANSVAAPVGDHIEAVQTGILRPLAGLALQR